MTIAAVSGQEAGTNANNATSVSKAFASNVAVGSLIVVYGMKFSPSNDAFVVGDCTQSAGTATLGTIALDVSANINQGDGKYAASALWSAIVTGAGSLTMQVAGAVTGSYILIAIGEYTGSWDASRLETSNSNSGAPATQSVSEDSGSVTSAGAALMAACLQINADDASSITEDSSFVSIYKNETATDDNGSAIRRIVTTGTTDTANWSSTSATGLTRAWAAVIGVYREATGADTLIGQACL